MAGERTHGTYTVVTDPIPKGISGFERATILNRQILEKRPAVEGKNTALAYGSLGAVLGLMLGLAGAAAARRNGVGAMVAGGTGLVLGGAVGAALSFVLSTKVFYPNLSPEMGLAVPFATHGGIWAGVGLVGGIAFGLGLGRSRDVLRALVGGLVGAIFATLVYEVIVGLFFSLERVESPLPVKNWIRLIAVALVAFCTTVGVVLAVQERALSKQASQPEIA
jgi:hypothetical protein